MPSKKEPKKKNRAMLVQSHVALTYNANNNANARLCLKSQPLFLAMGQLCPKTRRAKGREVGNYMWTDWKLRILV